LLNSITRGSVLPVSHSFTHPGIDAWNLPGFAYDARADRRSWTAMLALFEEVFA